MKNEEFLEIFDAFESEEEKYEVYSDMPKNSITLENLKAFLNSLDDDEVKGFVFSEWIKDKSNNIDFAVLKDNFLIQQENSDYYKYGIFFDWRKKVLIEESGQKYYPNSISLEELKGDVLQLFSDDKCQSSLIYDFAKRKSFDIDAADLMSLVDFIESDKEKSLLIVNLLKSGCEIDLKLIKEKFPESLKDASDIVQNYLEKISYNVSSKELHDFLVSLSDEKRKSEMMIKFLEKESNDVSFEDVREDFLSVLSKDECVSAVVEAYLEKKSYNINIKDFGDILLPLTQENKKSDLSVNWLRKEGNDLTLQELMEFLPNLSKFHYKDIIKTWLVEKGHDTEDFKDLKKAFPNDIPEQYLDFEDFRNPKSYKNIFNGAGNEWSGFIKGIVAAVQNVSRNEYPIVKINEDESISFFTSNDKECDESNVALRESLDQPYIFQQLEYYARENGYKIIGEQDFIEKTVHEAIELTEHKLNINVSHLDSILKLSSDYAGYKADSGMGGGILGLMKKEISLKKGVISIFPVLSINEEKTDFLVQVEGCQTYEIPTIQLSEFISDILPEYEKSNSMHWVAKDVGQAFLLDQFVVKKIMEENFSNNAVNTIREESDWMTYNSIQLLDREISSERFKVNIVEMSDDVKDIYAKYGNAPSEVLDKSMSVEISMLQFLRGVECHVNSLSPTNYLTQERIDKTKENIDKAINKAITQEEELQRENSVELEREVAGLTGLKPESGEQMINTTKVRG